MYIVIKAFYDLSDPVKVKVVKEGVLPLKYRLYLAGDVFPHPAAPFPTQERVAELAGSSNKQGAPLIAWVEDPEPEAPAEEQEPKKTAPKRKTRTKKE